MTLFSLLEDEVGHGVVKTPQELTDIRRGHSQLCNQTWLSNFFTYI